MTDTMPALEQAYWILLAMWPLFACLAVAFVAHVFTRGEV